MYNVEKIADFMKTVILVNKCINEYEYKTTNTKQKQTKCYKFHHIKGLPRFFLKVTQIFTSCLFIRILW